MNALTSSQDLFVSLSQWENLLPFSFDLAIILIWLAAPLLWYATTLLKSPFFQVTI
jgi:hypothetical protein